MRNKKGFTLAELAITLAVLAVMVASIITLTSVTISKTYERRISYMYRNECQNLTNCFTSTIFTMTGDDLNVTDFEEKIDFVYGLESETLDFKSHEFQSTAENKVIYEIYYNNMFGYTDSSNPNAKYKIVCTIDYSSMVNKLSLKVVELDNMETIYSLSNFITKGMGV